VGWSRPARKGVFPSYWLHHLNAANSDPTSRKWGVRASRRLHLLPRFVWPSQANEPRHAFTSTSIQLPYSCSHLPFRPFPRRSGGPSPSLLLSHPVVSLTCLWLLTGPPDGWELTPSAPPPPPASDCAKALIGGKICCRFGLPRPLSHLIEGPSSPAHLGTPSASGWASHTPPPHQSITALLKDFTATLKTPSALL
jgi:hypothetical protein